MRNCKNKIIKKGRKMTAKKTSKSSSETTKKTVAIKGTYQESVQPPAKKVNVNPPPKISKEKKS
jgi:hypothetical protein